MEGDKGRSKSHLAWFSRGNVLCSLGVGYSSSLEIFSKRLLSFLICATVGTGTMENGKNKNLIR